MIAIRPFLVGSTPKYNEFPPITTVNGRSGLVAEYWTHERQGVGSTLTRGPVQATSSKLLTYSVLRPTQPPSLSGMENE